MSMNGVFDKPNSKEASLIRQVEAEILSDSVHDKIS